jgi:UDP-GlcNAc:undecaprenyl-phosphate GlcNAc-1-phosphate transferase
MLLGMVLGMGLLRLPDDTAGALLAACAMLVTVGLIDDRFELSPWARLAAQIVAAIVLMIGSNAIVVTLGAPFGGEDVWLEGFTSYGFTALSVVAAINAFNMLDGMDGLAGALAVVALAALAILAHDGGLIFALSASLVIIGAVAAFLVSNLPISVNRDVRCFMGDSGSTLLGFAVVWLVIVVSQAPAGATAPATMLWVIALPLYELVWTVIRRAIRGMSPFKPDSDHLHHLVLRAGFGARGASIIFAAIAGLLASFGIAADRLGISDVWSFTLLIVVGIIVVRLMHRAELFWKLVPMSYRPSAIAVEGQTSGGGSK